MKGSLRYASGNLQSCHKCGIDLRRRYFTTSVRLFVHLKSETKKTFIERITMIFLFYFIFFLLRLRFDLLYMRMYVRMRV